MQATESRPDVRKQPAPAAGGEVFVLPASPAQARMWFLAQLAGGDAGAYAMPVAVRLCGALNTGALADALTGIVRRHEALRTTFVARDGEPVQVVHPPAPVPLPITDLSALPEETRAAEAERILRDEARRPFDLQRGPLMRALLIRLAHDEHLALCAMHHIVGDAWSLDVLLSELGAGYAAALEGRPSPLPEPALQYADYAAWQRTWVNGDAAARQLDYWKAKLAGAPVLALPTDHPRAAEPGSRGGRVAFRLPPEVFAAVRALGARHRATPMITLLAAFKTLLARYTGTADVVVGAPVAGRNRPELEGLIGLFVNTLALRTDLDGDPSFGGVVDRVRDTVVQAQAHQDLPFDRVADAVRTGADPRRNPLFEVSFTYASARRGETRLPGLVLSGASAGAETTRLDLEAHLTEEDDGGLQATLVYRAELYERATIERMAGHFVRLLEGALAAPQTRISALPLLGPDERRTVVEAWSAEGPAHPAEHCIHHLFQAQAARTPDAPAVVCGRSVLAYAELNARANRLAHHLRGLGVAPDARVAICVERGAEMLVAVLAVLKAGGAYVPLDPAYPAERLRYMLADSAPQVVLTQTSIAAARAELFDDLGARVLALDAPAWDGAPATDPEPGDLHPAHLAYVIYTSGSTGRPKGVMVAHRNAASLVAAQARTLGVQPDSRVLQFASFSFDACVFEMLMALCQGASLHVPPGADPLAGEALERVINEGRITHVTLPPAVLPTLSETAELPSVETMVLAGEALPAAAVRRWAGGRRMINAYGPTEAAVWTTFHECRVEERGNPPIGRPIPNARVYLLDPAGQPVPAAVAGELYIGGGGVARGYLGRPALTAERFVPDPFSGQPGARLYRTGDLGRWRADGTLEFLGRNDFQVKIRGFRIELGEVEARLREHPAVREAVVIAREEDGQDPRLVAYWLGEEADAEDLRRHAGERLPEYMVPTAFVHLDALPLTPNGKLDRRALPSPEGDAYARRGYEAPRGETEQALAEIWSEVLGVDGVGRWDDFLALGGNSLLVMQVAPRVHAALGVDLPLAVLLTDATIAGLAEQIAAEQGAAQPAPAAFPRADRAAPLPLSFPQERLWFLERAEDTDGAFTISAGVCIEGAGLDPDALERAFVMVMDRHEVLRTVFPAQGGQARQHVLPAAPFRLERADLRGEADCPAAVARLGRELAARPYDLARGPLLRALLARTGGAEHVLLLNLHHIVFDGWSAGVLVREVAACYEAVRAGRAPSLPELLVQYADYAAWQRAWAATDAAAEQLAWWTRRLAGLPALDLSAGRARAERAGYHGATLLVELGPERTERVRRAARAAQATEFMVLLAAFNVVLAHHARTRDLVVGTDLAGRARPELEPLIGFFINEVVLRTELSGDPDLREVLARVREVALDAYRHQDVPFALVVRELGAERRPGGTPLFQVMFGMDNTPAAGLGMDGLRMTPVDAGADVSPWELSLYLREGPRGITGSFRYRTALFDAAAVDDLRADFLVVADALCGDPGERLGAVLERLAAAGRQRWEDRARILEGAARLRLRARSRQAIAVAAD